MQYWVLGVFVYAFVLACVERINQSRDGRPKAILLHFDSIRNQHVSEDWVSQLTSVLATVLEIDQATVDSRIDVFQV